MARALPSVPTTTTSRRLALSTVKASQLVFFDASSAFLTNDAGATWKALTLPAGVCLSPTFDGAGTLFTACAGKLYAMTLP